MNDPHWLIDDFGRKTILLVRRSLSIHDSSLPELESI